ncbi:MAG: hypothetical protein EBR99_05920, partial [Actinobacteria bacterium]|nr:hypothetical protein [Actinomycetota bacterium]
MEQWINSPHAVGSMRTKRWPTTLRTLPVPLPPLGSTSTTPPRVPRNPISRPPSWPEPLPTWPVESSVANQRGASPLTGTPSSRRSSRPTTNGDIPESIISGLAEVGGFGLSVPEEYGGFADGSESDYLGMVVATEELTWGGLGIGGSLITRPEILTRALVSGGTEEQKEKWLPKLATAEVMAAVAVTEPDYGSDVAGITTMATKTEGGWLVNGTKTWCTFGARANVLMLLARTDPDRSKTHRGLSLFLVEKPVADGHGFLFTQDASSEGRNDANGRLEGRPIDTLGYRGMHSYEINFDNWFVPDANLVGGEAGLGKGFYYQMAGFENGRIQTAARAVGLMQAAYEAALDYATNRTVFGNPISDYQLTKLKLGRMAVITQASRQFSYAVAKMMGKGEGANPRRGSPLLDVARWSVRNRTPSEVEADSPHRRRCRRFPFCSRRVRESPEAS